MLPGSLRRNAHVMESTHTHRCPVKRNCAFESNLEDTLKRRILKPVGGKGGLQNV
ncbi:uncharacterized protein ARMOST_00033 [Armillaria ostoyae]|uniref:Uncharacterized protein n=1 Tax=Armillaria ostoyae TaxID=47428 RepID=A0A284QK02_ARMOS|nr:uncharacterized protein ARMOST_00033 [Armillaria ostoyae]